jgi:hypothetical protein
MPLRRLLLSWMERFLEPGRVREHSSGIVSACPGGSSFAPGAPDDRPGTGEPRSAPGFPRLAPSGQALAGAALLSVDDAGQCLLVGRTELTLGHLRAGRADLLFLADVGAVHARLARRDSLREGPGWSIAPVGRERVEVNGLPLRAEGRPLRAEDRVALGENLEFVFTLPDPTSESACLELLHGAECAGARTVILLGDGAGARVRIGAALQRHVRVPNLEHEIELARRGERLLVRADVPLRAPQLEQPCIVALPPARRLDFTCGEQRGSRPPFGFSLAPVERPAPEPGRERGREKEG